MSNRMTTKMGRIAALGSCAVLVGVLAMATPAWAHVTVHPATVTAGSTDIELTFRVPNERDDANTVGVEVYFPADLPLLAVEVEPVPGWTSKVDMKTLDKPIQTDDGPVAEVVSDIIWTATAGGITSGQYQDFPVAAGQMPTTTGDLAFKSLQTYSNGDVVRWIQIATTQNPAPDAPAPMLTVTDPTATVAQPGTSNTTEALAIGALVVALIGLAGVVLLLFRDRRGGRVGTDGAGADSAGGESAESVR